MILAVGFGLLAAFIYFAIVFIRKWKARRKQAQEIIEQAQRENRERLEIARKRSLQHAANNTYSVPPRGYETTKKYTPTYAPSPTQSVRESRRDDDTLDTLAMMMVMNAITSHNQPSNDYTPSTRSEVTYDSSPSYKDDSPSSSWSSSSSSDSSSSWSSSDSGPSSDW